MKSSHSPRLRAAQQLRQLGNVGAAIRRASIFCFPFIGASKQTFGLKSQGAAGCLTLINATNGQSDIEPMQKNPGRIWERPGPSRPARPNWVGGRTAQPAIGSTGRRAALFRYSAVLTARQPCSAGSSYSATWFSAEAPLLRMRLFFDGPRRREAARAGSAMLSAQIEGVRQ